jgi:hypothetical protein
MNRKNSNIASQERNLCSTSPELQLEIVDENLTANALNKNIITTTSTTPSTILTSSVCEPSSSAAVGQKDTYVNIMYNNTTDVAISPGTIESPIEDDDDAEMMKSRTRKSSRTPFRFKHFSLMKSGSFKLKQMSPQPTELVASSSPIDEPKSTLEGHQKAPPGSTRSSRLKKLFMLSRADPSRKIQKDVSLRNLKHVL